MESTVDSVASVTAAESQTPEGLTEYRETLRARLRDQQAAFDKSILFVAAGAFTVSAAFFPRLPDPLQWPGVLIAAWSAWAACVAAVLVGHVLSVEAHTRVLDLLDAGEYDPDVLMSDWRIRVIAKLNRVEFAALLVGFILFAVFTYTNLNFGGSNGEQSGRTQQQGGVVEDRPQQERGASERQKHAGPTERSGDNESRIYTAPTVEAPAQAMKESHDDGERETATAAATSAASPPDARSATGKAASGEANAEEQSTGRR